MSEPKSFIYLIPIFATRDKMVITLDYIRARRDENDSVLILK